MIPMVNEVVRCLEEDIVGSAAEADMALLYGLGFLHSAAALSVIWKRLAWTTLFNWQTSTRTG